MYITFDYSLQYLNDKAALLICCAIQHSTRMFQHKKSNIGYIMYNFSKKIPGLRLEFVDIEYVALNF